MPKSSQRPRKPTVNCGGCGAPIVPAGRPPKSGVWFCMKPPCRAAKQREYRDAILATFGAERGIEDRPCSNCGEHMLSRKKRVDDIPDGRWCTRTKCQLAKQRYRHQLMSHTPEEMEHVNTLAFIEAKKGAPIFCTACGFDRAVPGFIHPTPDCTPEKKSWCRHLGARLYSADEAVTTWPTLLTSDPEILAWANRQSERRLGRD